MVKSLYSGVSGLKTHQQRMDVIGNNIANVNTTGYKTNVVTFADVYYQTKRSPSGATATLGGVNPMQTGYGVKMNSTTANMSQSGFTYSDSIYDMALDGEGFFQLMDGAGNLLYTRAGVFNIDEQGYLVNASGYHVLGISGDSTGQAPGSEIIRIIIPDTQAKASSATKEINGTNVTLSMSAPSDNSNISVAFTNSAYPFATYSNGILNIFMNMNEQYNSETDFQNAINAALAAGGVTLPDDLDLNIAFESIPNDPEAVAATNTVESWSYTTSNSTVEFYVPYDYNTGIKDSGGTDIIEQRNARIAFATPELTEDTGVEYTISIAAYDDSAAHTEVSYSDGTWTITPCPNTTASDINKAIAEYIEAHPDDDIPALTCTAFSMPSTDNGNKETAFAAISGVGDKKMQGGKGSVSQIRFDATEPGAYANDYKIVFAYTSNYGTTKAAWDENTLTITIGNDTKIEDINAAIKAAANGDPKKLLTMTGMSELENMNPAQRKALFEGNPSMSLGGGKDSFFTEIAKSLSTFNLVDGRTGSPQSYKDLENVTIQTDGTIIGKHAVHGDIVLGRIDIATFDNPNGLSAVGGTNFVQTVASGNVKLSIAGESGAGEIVAGALEMSNVDLSQEFTDMITTQRGYQANSRVITTSDTMLEELLNLKR